MSRSESNCQWHFDKHAGREEGPNDALGQNFRVKPYASLVRESIQNSLDVPISEDKPVRVEFSFGKLRSNSFENFFNLKEHIQGCRDYFSENKRAVSKYTSMLGCFDDEYVSEMPYIKVSDYNTKGMDYIKGNNNLPFYAFVRAASISVKNEGSTGGTYGFGKAAYFQLSPINTVLVSTMTDSGRHFFEGASVLCTHTVDGEKLTSVGFYDANDGEPSSTEETTPAKFWRDEAGSDFYIMGFSLENSEEATQEMISEVLRHFFAAIVKKKLVVVITPYHRESVEISSLTIDDLMEAYFPDNCDVSGQKRTTNPKPYYQAIATEEDGRIIKCYKKVFPTLGELKLYVKRDENGSNRIMLMRKPLMFVDFKKGQTGVGFYGVLICDNPVGDELLSKLENSSHDQWRKENFRDDVTNRPIKAGSIAIEEIEEMIDYCIQDMSGAQDKVQLDIASLDDYLYVPDSLIDDDDIFAKERPLGQPSGEFIPESGSLTTDSEILNRDSNSDNNVTNLGSILIEVPKSIKSIEDGKDIVGVGHKNKKPKSKGGLPASGESLHNGEVGENDGHHITIMNCPIRIAAQMEDGIMNHVMIIHSDRDVRNGTVELMVCGEQSDEEMNILSSNLGVPNCNRITNLAFNAGVCRIKFRFADNMMHAVKTRLYYED